MHLISQSNPLYIFYFDDTLRFVQRNWCYLKMCFGERQNNIPSKLYITVIPIKISRLFFTDTKYNLNSDIEVEKIKDSQGTSKQIDCGRG